MQGNYLEQALGMIHSRRLAAEQQNRERIMEIESRIPEVSEVNYQMFRTSRDLMQIIVRSFVFSPLTMICIRSRLVRNI